jgi:hypothetical protein
MRAARKARREEVERAEAPDEACDRTYRVLLSRLTLYKYHLSYLTGQGLTPEDCAANVYKSLPVGLQERIALCEELITEGCNLESVPGFFRIPDDAPDEHSRGQWCVGGDRWGRRLIGVAGEAEYKVGGFLVPVRDRLGKIVRLELHNNPPPLRAPATVRCVWPSCVQTLSSLRQPTTLSGGASGGARLHYPLRASGGRAGALIVADGALAADIIVRHFDSEAVAAPAVGMMDDELIEVMRRYDDVCIASGGQACAYTRRLRRRAEEAGIETFVIRWEPECGMNFGEVLTGGGVWWVEPGSYYGDI